MNDIISGALLRSILAFILVTALARVMGRKLIANMTFFDFVVGVTIGSTTANLAMKGDLLTTAITVLLALSLMTVLTDILRLKSFRFRKLVDAEPVVLMSNGRIIAANLRKIRLTVDELLMLLRQKNIFNLGDIEFALMEADGSLSVLPKSQKQPVTPADLKIDTVYHGLSKDLIIDGCLLRENLQDMKLNEEWLRQQLRNQNVREVKNVFYAGLDSAGNLYVSEKQSRTEKHGQYGIE